MIKKFNNLMILSISICALFAILGILVILYPEMSLNIFAYVLSFGLIIAGVTLLCTCSESFIFINFMSTGILLILLGIIILFNPNSLSLIVPIITGIWAISSSVTNLELALALKKINYKNWILVLILSILSLICGIIMIASPTEGAITLTTLFGALILIYSISNFINLIIFKNNVNDLVKVIK